MIIHIANQPNNLAQFVQPRPKIIAAHTIIPKIGTKGTNGGDSTFVSITSTGGGGGGTASGALTQGSTGGSGGGTADAVSGTVAGGSGTASQGYAGGLNTGNGSGTNGTGGGGADRPRRCWRRSAKPRRSARRGSRR
jgi:hypothetical protein